MGCWGDGSTYIYLYIFSRNCIETAQMVRPLLVGGLDHKSCMQELRLGSEFESLWTNSKIFLFQYIFNSKMEYAL